MPSHLQRCQGIAVGNYSFTLGRLEAGTPSTFAQSGFHYARDIKENQLQYGLY
jgi:hypothetical protein